MSTKDKIKEKKEIKKATKKQILHGKQKLHQNKIKEKEKKI